MSVRGFNTGSGVEQYDYEYLDNKPEIPTKKSDIGLGNVDNTSDLDKPISTATQTALNQKVPITRKVNNKELSTDITLTSEDIGYDASTAYGSGTVGKELTELNRQISESITPAIEEIETALDGKAPVIVNTASGEIASFADGADGMPVKPLVAQIEPVQDLHGYENPWPAGGGANKLGLVNDIDKTVAGVRFTYDANTGLFTVNGTNTNTSAHQMQVWLATGSSIFPNFQSGETYTLFVDNTSLPLYMQFTYKNTSEVTVSLGYCNFSYGHITFTVPDDFVSLIGFQMYLTTGVTTINGSFHVWLVEGTVSSSTFVPYSNICPISGHAVAEIEQTGKNLCKLPVVAQAIVNNTLENCFFVKKGQYMATFSNPVNCTSFRACIYLKDSSGNNLLEASDCPSVGNVQSTGTYWRSGSDVTFPYTLPINIVNDCYIRFTLGLGDVGNSSSCDCMLNTGSTATPYEPYTGNQISVTFPSSAGTVYGGTLTINPDRTGTLVVDRVFVNLTDLSWTRGQSGYREYRALFRTSQIPPAYYVSDSITSDIVCSCYKALSPGQTYRGANRGISANDRYMSIGEPSADSVETFMPFINGQTAAYRIASPITYQLTKSEISGILETLYGTNNIWSDVGTVDVEYHADTKLYIEQLTKPTEDDMTANANIAANKFFMIGNTLYFSTAAIAAGATIIPGTNCNVVSLADALNNLNS